MQAPSAIPFAEGYPSPKGMTLEEIKRVQDAYVEATLRSEIAGCELRLSRTWRGAHRIVSRLHRGLTFSRAFQRRH